MLFIRILRWNPSGRNLLDAAHLQAAVEQFDQVVSATPG